MPVLSVEDSQDRYASHLADVIMAFWVNHCPDTRHGGFYGALDREGNHRGEKGSLWKTPYHTARACIELVRRLNGLCIQTAGETKRI
jgi:mannose/cellobiose epimerase-like protein (N-acyl-D-glucosamine 2-epimerase family)